MIGFRFNSGPSAKEKPVTRIRQEKGFFDKAENFLEGTWEKAKQGVKKAWDWTVSTAKGAWKRLTSKAGKIAGGIALAATAIIGIFRKYGQQIRSGVQSTYSGARPWIRNLLGIRHDYPHGTIHTIDTTDKELAHASDLTYLDVIYEKNIKTTLGEEWVEEQDLYLNLPNGLQAHVFVNDETNEMIIAFRGTEKNGKIL